jgi:hypothetical protein
VAFGRSEEIFVSRESVVTLDSHHRATVAKIFGHPTSHNVQWHDVVSLVRGIGAHIEVHEARFTLTIGSETEGFERAKGHDLDEQQLVDLRRMLTNVGVAPRSIETAVSEGER